MRSISARAEVTNSVPSSVGHNVERSPSAGALFAPLPDLLRSGGDNRLFLLPQSVINEYGCSPIPQFGVVECASSTATSISERAYAQAEHARTKLLEKALFTGFDAAFDTRIEEMRCELLCLLGLEGLSAEIVFAPSGTDSALHANFVAAEVLDGPCTSVMVGADETGSGISLAAAAQHFSAHTALGSKVQKGTAIEGFSGVLEQVSIAVRDDAGKPLKLGTIDFLVVEAVEDAIKRGQRVLLHAMDCSKTGLFGPSLACLDHIASRWPASVQILVDACQMRLSRARLRHYLARNFMVLITGSKFFTGPPFSGALLVPSALSNSIAGVSAVPGGLGRYTAKSSWPQSWAGIRAGLPSLKNFGEWLRWEAALEEMRAYFAVPPTFRAFGLQKFASYLPGRIAEIGGLGMIEAGSRTG